MPTAEEAVEAIIEEFNGCEESADWTLRSLLIESLNGEGVSDIKYSPGELARAVSILGKALAARQKVVPKIQEDSNLKLNEGSSGDPSAATSDKNALPIITTLVTKATGDRKNEPVRREVKEGQKIKMQVCKVRKCLIEGTTKVGITELDRRPLERSLLGKIDRRLDEGGEGAKFKLGKGKVTKRSVEAAKELLNREMSQVSSKKYD